MQTWALNPLKDQSEGTSYQRRLFYSQLLEPGQRQILFVSLAFSVGLFFFFLSYLSLCLTVYPFLDLRLSSPSTCPRLCMLAQVFVDSPRVSPCCRYSDPMASKLAYFPRLMFQALKENSHSCSLRYSVKRSLSICHLSVLYLYLIEVLGSPFCHMLFSQFLSSITFAMPKILSPDLFLSSIFLQKPITRTSSSEKSEDKFKMMILCVRNHPLLSWLCQLRLTNLPAPQFF